MNRRQILKNSIVAMSAMAGASALANQPLCSSLFTPSQPEGPFYPVVDQVDTDADLIIVSGRSKVADGKVVIVEGTVQDQNCAPVSGALVEIWQACKTGKYDHPSDPNPAPLDPNFQYWGKAVTNTNGFYRFRTIIPGAYPAARDWVRPPHIHFKVSKLGYIELITQMYFEGEEFNKNDKILQRLSSAEQKDVIISFLENQSLELPVGTFNIRIEKI